MDGHQAQGNDGAPPEPVGGERNRYIDFLRAFSLLVVVAWHWVFTIVRWKSDGPHATNPIGFTTGLWGGHLAAAGDAAVLLRRRLLAPQGVGEGPRSG